MLKKTLKTNCNWHMHQFFGFKTIFSSQAKSVFLTHSLFTSIRCAMRATNKKKEWSFLPEKMGGPYLLLNANEVSVTVSSDQILRIRLQKRTRGTSGPTVAHVILFEFFNSV